MHLVGIQHAVIVGQKGVCGVRGGLCPAAGDAANGRAWARRAGLWGQMYAADIKGGLPEIAPGKLLRALRIQVLYRVRSEHPFMEQTPYRLLFCWFGGLTMVVARYAESCPATDRSRP